MVLSRCRTFHVTFDKLCENSKSILFEDLELLNRVTNMCNLENPTNALPRFICIFDQCNLDQDIRSRVLEQTICEHGQASHG
jgi:hypothetical protein